MRNFAARSTKRARLKAPRPIYKCATGRFSRSRLDRERRRRKGYRPVTLCTIRWSMKHKVEKHHRRSIRLKGYDYANSGAYFVTIVTQGRACLFGEIVNAETRLNDAGSAIERWWFELNNKFSTVET